MIDKVRKKQVPKSIRVCLRQRNDQEDVLAGENFRLRSSMLRYVVLPRVVSEAGVWGYEWIETYGDRHLQCH